MPVLIGTLVIVLMTTWRRGNAGLRPARAALEGPLDTFIEHIRSSNVMRVPGVAVYPHPNCYTTPLALSKNLQFNRIVHEHVVIVTIVEANVPHVRHVDRVSVKDLGYNDDGIVYIECRVGFNDRKNVPLALELAIGKSDELNFEEKDAMYYVSVFDLQWEGTRSLRTWRRQLFVAMTHIAASRIEIFRLPEDRTVVMGRRIPIDNNTTIFRRKKISTSA